MQIKLKTKAGIVALADRNYLAAGGEAAVYKDGNGKLVYKLYHDPAKMIPVGKIAELGLLSAPNIIKPLEPVYDATTGQPLGYSMKFISDTEPLCKLFTKTFKDANAIDGQMTLELVKNLQVTIESVHGDRCLIVDMNELNILVDDSFVKPLMIDTDSYQTPSYHATAIKDSIRDRKSPRGKFNEMTDWFSFAVLAFWCYINIHPYKGRHPSYKITEWDRRMDDGVSAFDPKVSLPAMCNPIKSIPSRHRTWLEAVFTRGERSKPPLPDASAPLPIPAGIQIIQGTATFDVQEVSSYDDLVIWAAAHLGTHFVVTRKSVYAGQHKIAAVQPRRRAAVVVTTSGDPIVALEQGSLSWSFVHKGQVIGHTSGRGLFARNNCFYAITDTSLVESAFRLIGTRIFPETTRIGNVSSFAAQPFDGVVVQDLLGKKHLTIPYKKGACFTRHVPTLDTYRVVSAKSEGPYCVVLGETNGVYYRFILHIGSEAIVEITRQPDVSPDEINFAVKDNGLGLLATSTNDVLMFAPGGCRNLVGAPFDSSMRLFASGADVFFCHNDSVFKVRSRSL